MKSAKVFVGLWIVVGLFVIGVVLILMAAFTTHPTVFAGQADLHLAFQDPSRKPLSPKITDEKGNPVVTEADGRVLLHPKFEPRETNIFDQLSGGPRPRTAFVSFTEDGAKHHELTFTFDRHDRVWKSEVSFSDPTISKADVEKSTLVFKGLDGEKRVYESAIFATALIGPPVVTND